MKTSKLLSGIGLVLLTAFLTQAVAQTVETVTTTTLHEPYAVAVNPADNAYYISDGADHEIVKFDSATGELTQVTGGIFNPQGVVLARGGLVVSDAVNELGDTYWIRFVSFDGAVSTIAGGAAGYVDANGAAARFRGPAGLAVDSATGDIYIADMLNNRIRKLDALNNVTTVASGFNRPAAVAVGADGKLYVADTGNHVIKSVNLADGVVTTIAGRVGVSGSDGGLATSARFSAPAGLHWVGGETGLLVSDTGNHTVRKVFQKLGTWQVADIVGMAGNSGLVNAAGAAARFTEPIGLAVDVSGMILIADSKNNALRRIVRSAVTFPALSLGSGSYSNTISLTITNKTEPLNTVFRFTSDGTDPLPSSPVFTTPFSVDGGADETGHYLLKVRGFSPDAASSQILSNRYSFVVHPLSVAFAGGSFNNDITQKVSSVTTGATIRFTSNATEPTDSSTVWSDGAYGQTGSFIVKGFRDRFIPSILSSNSFSFFVAPAAISPSGLTTNDTVRITLSTGTTAAELRYTLDGSTPTATSTAYSGPFTLDANARGSDSILTVVGFKPGYTPSAPSSQTYSLVVAKPVISLVGGSFNNNQNVNVTSSTPGATIRFTTDGTDPNESSTLWVNGSYGIDGLLKVRGFRAGFLPSEVTTAQFSFTVANPLVSPVGTTTNNAINVTITSATAGAELRYTLDDSEPTVTSTLYAGTFQLATNTLGNRTILRVAGFKGGYVVSSTVSQAYVFEVATPTMSIAGGNFVNDTNVNITTLTSGATLRFTTDGSDPTESSTEWSNGPFGIDGLLRVRAFRDGFLPSGIVANQFNFTVASPTIATAGGTFNNGITVTINNGATSGAELRYTLDGSDPTSSSALYEGAFALATNVLAGKTTVAVAGFKANYKTSATQTRDYVFKVATPTVSVAGGSFINNTNVTVSTVTTGATIRFTTDGLEPTTSSLPWVNGSYGTDGPLQVRAFRDGFIDSDVVGRQFNFTVAKPTISLAGGTYNNAVTVSLASDTAAADLRYTLDGSAPTTSSPLFGGAFDITANARGTNSILTVTGFKAAYQNSASSSETYVLTAAAPVISAPSLSGTAYVNSVAVTAGTATSASDIRYTLNGADPTAASTLYADGITLATTNALRVATFRAGFNTSSIVVTNYPIRVDKPVLAPPGGFFPNGTDVTATVLRAGARLYYTINGNEPTEADSPYTGPIDVDALRGIAVDLRFLKVRAFADDVLPSDVATGEISAVNAIGIPSAINAGIGSAVIVPVVLNLKSNQVLRTIQFSVAVAPSSPGTPNLEFLDALNTSLKDFVRVLDGTQLAGVSTFDIVPETDAGPGGVLTNILSISYVGTNANFSVRDFATVTTLKLVLPPSAVQGQTYSISIRSPSGTEDGGEKRVALAPLSDRTITVTNISYLVGDSSPAGWYNAGDFGDRILDNADVNNAFYAAMNVRVPFGDTDILNAMDVFPPDSVDAVGGDGFVKFLDWQVILRRSLGRDQERWFRTWATDGVRLAIPPPGAANHPASALELMPGAVWVREAMVHAMPHPQPAAPGQVVDIPVQIRIARGKSISGMLFRMIVQPSRRAPALTKRPAFRTADGIPAPIIAEDLPLNEVGVAWGLDKFNPPLQGTVPVLLGYLSVEIPAGAILGDSYRVQFDTNGGGAPDIHTQFNFESHAAVVMVNTPPPPTDTDPISDEWRHHFFRRSDGTIDEVRAAMHADADNDGVPNWKEFMAGTSPTDAESRLQLAAERETGTGKVRLKWLTAPGKRYTIEGTSNLAGGAWTKVADGVEGTGQHRDLEADPKAAYYRIRLIDEQP